MLTSCQLRNSKSNDISLSDIYDPLSRKFTKLYQRLSTKFSCTFNRCFFHFNLHCQFRKTDREEKRLCNLHYRLLDGCYTVAYKDSCGNCPQFISLLIYLNFSSIYKSCDFFLDWFLGYWSKVDTYTGYKYNPGKYEFSDSLMVARNTYRNCDVMSTPYPPLHYLFPLAHVRTAGLFLLIGDNFVMWTLRG